MRSFSPLQRKVGRGALFAALVTLIGGAYASWRPPLAMLGLRHVEHLGEQPEISLTFDDAPHPMTTPLLLAALKRAGAKGTFFIIGDGARFYPEITRRIVQNGHALANHSHHHRNLTRIQTGEITDEVEPCFDTIRAAASGSPSSATSLFRPPGGGLNWPAIETLYQSKRTLAWWSLNTGDWQCPPAWRIVETVKAKMRPGDIVLLHDGGLGTPQAIPAIVRYAHTRGYQVVPMPEE